MIGPAFVIDAQKFLVSEAPMSLTHAQAGREVRRILQAVANGNRGFLFPIYVGRVSWPTDRRPHIPLEIRRAVLARDGYACRYCGGTVRLELDHVEAYVHGGQDTIDNLQVLCLKCNRKKGQL